MWVKQPTQVRFFQPLPYQFTMSSSVHRSDGTKPPLCILYALVDLIETENVMFHSGASLIGCLRTTWPIRFFIYNFFNGGWVLMNLIWWVGKKWCEWLIVIVGRLASSVWFWRDVMPDWLTNYRCLLWLCFMFHTLSSGWNDALAAIYEMLHFVGFALRPPIKHN